MEEKTFLNSLDLYFLVNELQSLREARIQKIYQIGKEVHLELYVRNKGTMFLVLGDGRFFLTKHKFTYPEEATTFAMTLRKYLSGLHFKSVKQHAFDRIIIVEADGFKLIGELIPQGNVVLADKENKILAVLERQLWEARTLKQRESYVLPPQRTNILELKTEDIYKILLKEEKKIVVWLAGVFGGVYAEELCLRARIDKNTPSKDLREDQVERLVKEVNDLFGITTVPQIIFHKIPINVTPFSLELYHGFEKKIFSNMNEAVAQYFIERIEIEAERASQAKLKGEKETLERRKEGQKAAIKAMYEAKGEYNVKAKLIYENYIFLQEIVEKAKENLKDAQKISPQITAVDLKNKTITVDFDGIPVEIFVEIPLVNNASLYYEKAKIAKGKAKGAEAALKVTEEKVVKEEEKRVVEKKEEKKAWYDKFRNFKSSEGFLVAAGKDATSNEVLIKKHTSPEDMVFHADISGSPFAVVKTEGKTPSETTILETAQFTASYSKVWKEGVGLADVYWIKPEQVSKKAPSGEYVPKGAFMIYGQKNLLKTELKIAIGLREFEVISGPVSAVKTNTLKYVVIKPGTTKASELAKQIKAKLFGLGSKEQQEWIRKLNVDEIKRLIPFGQGELA